MYYLEAYINNFPSINIGNNTRLLKTYYSGKKETWPNVRGYSYTIEYGGAANEFGVDLKYFLCLDSQECKKIITTFEGAKDSPDSTLDTNDEHSSSEDFMTREMVMQTLYELAGKPSVKGLSTGFKDVEQGSWYENALKWGQSKKIALGYPNVCSDTFGVGELVTRQDLALMMHRYTIITNKNKSAFDYGRTDWFDDFKNIDYYAWGPFTWAIQWEFLLPNKKGNKVYPRGRVTRDELKYALSAMIERNTGKAPSSVPIPSSAIKDIKMVPAKAATCTEDGNTAYWYSESTKKYYKDSLGKTEIEKDSWIIPAAHKENDVIKAATFEDDGHVKTTCTVCKEVIRDEDIPHIAEVKLAASQFIYTGKALTSLVKATDANGGIISPENYTFVIKDSSGNTVEEAKNVGTYSLGIKFKNLYKGSVDDLGEFRIVKAANPLKIKAGRKYTVKYSKLKKAKIKIPYTSVISFTNRGQGTLIFKKKSGNKKITISKGGKVTIKKKLRKGTYKIKVKVTAAGNSNYKSSSTKTVTFKIRVK